MIEKFTFQPQYEFDVSSNFVNVKNSQNRIIGYVEAKDVPAFKNGDTSRFRPVSEWRTTFSLKLKEFLNLPTTENAETLRLAKSLKNYGYDKQFISKAIYKYWLKQTKNFRDLISEPLTLIVDNEYLIRNL